jgi:gliding motility-associated-like protein
MIQKIFSKINFLPTILVCAAGLWPIFANATHNRAGEILITQIGNCGDYRIRATIVTYTKRSSTAADRDSLTISWGDGTFKQLPRTNGPTGEDLGNDIQKNIYIGEHQFAGAARYVVSMTDPNRIKGIINVNPPSSDNVPFHIETVYVIPDCQFGSFNSTPILLQPPIDFACIGQPFKHNPNAWDADGDSLSYKLIVPLGDVNSPVPNYTIPGQGNFNSLFSLNEKTGDMLWNSPQIAGEYNVAFYVISWRQLIPGAWSPTDTTIRDMQILVENCKNLPPIVVATDQICVIAGDTVEFEVKVTDLDSLQKVKLTALGGPFQVSVSPATFDVQTGFQLSPLVGKFRWITTCEHISDQFYSVIFKGSDNFFDSTGLVDLKQVRIKVVGPPPLDLAAISENDVIKLSWEQPYICEMAADDYFYAFSVWRREGSNPFAIDTCAPGLTGKGYTKLIDSTEVTLNNRYYFEDKNVERGHTYCYRIEGKFAKTSFGGYPFNIVASLPSAEVCAQLPRDLPLLTNVSILKTDASTGEIEVRWSKPEATDLDTNFNKPPYRYQVLRSTGFVGANLVEIPSANFTSPTFFAANDTFFIDNQRDTRSTPWTYRVDFYVEGGAKLLGSTTVASSVFLKISSTDRQNNLSWEEQVSWNNLSYEVFRFDQNLADFVKIATVIEPFFADTGLINQKEYCYKIKSVGTYSISGIVDPILNFSQEDCGTPIDTVPPCPPVLSVSNLCTTGATFDLTKPLENNLIWTNPNNICGGSNDVASYTIYQKNGDVVEALQTLNSANDTSYTHFLTGSLANCYFVKVVDSLGNSAISNEICADNCPNYVLPNTFTPNDDGSNELFKPFPDWRFVEKIDLKIFNRWGNLVFETTDPAINWNGQNLSKKELASGTYYYVCRVIELRVGGNTERALSGWIELIR